MIFNINPVSAALFQIYILQLDEYDIFRYLKKISKVKRGKKQIKPFVWTSKAKAIFALSFLQILIVSVVISNLNLAFLIILILLGFEIFFIPLVISVILLYPLDYFIKHYLVSKATSKIRNLKNLKIIAIAGSYGKTTFKEILYSVLSEKYNVLKTPENVNTPVAISRLILSKLKEEHEIFIVELGEYYKGDIKKLCEITPPDISVVTGINEAHFERLKSIDTTVSTIFEVVTYSKENAVLVLNLADDLVRKNYKKYVKNKKIITFGDDKKSGLFAFDIKFNENDLTLGFKLNEGNSLIDSFNIPILAKYSLDDIIGSVQIAKILDTPLPFIKRGINKIKPIPHRLEPNFDKSKNIIFIDDTYNANPKGIKSAIEILSEFKNRRKIYITPGMVETGKANRQIHLDIAEYLSKVADIVILIDTSSSCFIKEGLKDNSFPDDKIKIYNHQQDVYDDLNSWTKAGDVVLFQNIWPENYV
ncbi:hypothetical protein A3F29_03460 [Candidatus Roizmanbacteria bacterium RIFCSPHIGHO2_12_FULL_33_9]|uniref:Mur ligase central domain-containing protein n=1 Tax=Candidatus Roizmanbacteria bacterium RIFCSPHIGHO2_12_FULL_33_9 TaxID=1802045 RepID=A0A1F7HG71_9BACT|nr:MAG: hypothetical protein A3F29_03460 [Candidatus Roizmanbacteria bacterium RIFCSPHIGHO2_12_FULL_33_9]